MFSLLRLFTRSATVHVPTAGRRTDWSLFRNRSEPTRKPQSAADTGSWSANHHPPASTPTRAGQRALMAPRGPENGVATAMALVPSRRPATAIVPPVAAATAKTPVSPSHVTDFDDIGGNAASLLRSLSRSLSRKKGTTVEDGDDDTDDFLPSGMLITRPAPGASWVTHDNLMASLLPESHRDLGASAAADTAIGYALPMLAPSVMLQRQTEERQRTSPTALLRSASPQVRVAASIDAKEATGHVGRAQSPQPRVASSVYSQSTASVDGYAQSPRSSVSQGGSAASSKSSVSSLTAAASFSRGHAPKNSTGAFSFTPSLFTIEAAAPTPQVGKAVAYRPAGREVQHLLLPRLFVDEAPLIDASALSAMLQAFLANEPF